MVKVLVVGQTPPPFGGQAVMIDRLVKSQLEDVQIVHVRMNFSSNMNEVGRFRFAKITRLFKLIALIVYHRFADGTRILYYPPGGADRMPMIRDVAVLASTRWLFDATIFHYHASGLSNMCGRLSGVRRRLFERAYYRAEAAVRISPLTPEDGTRLECQREFIVPNGIDDPLAEVDLDRKFVTPSAERPLVLLYVGVLCEPKGVLVLVEACGRLLAAGVPFRLHLMGQPQSAEFMEDLQRRIDELSLRQHVKFLGVLTGADKDAAYAEADVLCHPTWYDTFPVVLIEAMAVRLPVLSTRHSGIPSIIDEGENGLLVEPRDAAALAEQLERLAGDAGLREQLGNAGREKFLREFTIDRHIERMRQMFLVVAGVPRKAAATEPAQELVAS